jgi:hypothetical protein
MKKFLKELKSLKERLKVLEAVNSDDTEILMEAETAPVAEVPVS